MQNLANDPGKVKKEDKERASPQKMENNLSLFEEYAEQSNTNGCSSSAVSAPQTRQGRCSIGTIIST